MTQTELIEEYRRANKVIEGVLRSIDNDYKEQLKRSKKWPKHSRLHGTMHTT